MTELAPVGYVGISPKCLLGFNKVSANELFVSRPSGISAFLGHGSRSTICGGK